MRHSSQSFKTISGFASCLWHVTVPFRVHALCAFVNLFIFSTVYKNRYAHHLLCVFPVLLLRWLHLAMLQHHFLIKRRWRSVYWDDKQYVSTTIYVLHVIAKIQLLLLLLFWSSIITTTWTNCVCNLMSVPIDIYFN